MTRKVVTSARHRWGKRIPCGPRKSEKECARCGTVRASMHGINDHGQQDHWKEFWRDGELISRNKTPPCDTRLEVPA